MTAAASSATAPTGGLWIAVINLLRADDRRARMTEMFGEIGVAVEYFPALDMLDPAVRQRLDALPQRGAWAEFYLQDKACALSHIEVHKTFLGRDEETCLVFEDDVFVSADLADWIPDLSWIPSDADIVKIEKWMRKSGSVLLGSDARRHLDRSIARLYSRHQGGAGYFVTRRGAEKVVNEPATLNASIDHWLFNPEGSPLARKLVVYQVDPALVRQGNEPERRAGAPARIDRKENKFRRELSRAWLRLKFLPTALALRLGGRALPRHIGWQDRMNAASAG